MDLIGIYGLVHDLTDLIILDTRTPIIEDGMILEQVASAIWEFIVYGPYLQHSG